VHAGSAQEAMLTARAAYVHSLLLSEIVLWRLSWKVHCFTDVAAYRLANIYRRSVILSAFIVRVRELIMVHLILESFSLAPIQEIKAKKP